MVQLAQKPMRIVRERRSDAAAIEGMVAAAFGPDRMQKTVYKLRENVKPIRELCTVALDDNGAWKVDPTNPIYFLVRERQIAERVIKEALNVRQTEGLIAKLQSRDGARARSARTPLATDAHVTNLENKIRERLGTKVQLRYALGKGSLEVSFYSDAELERILQILGVNAE